VPVKQLVICEIYSQKVYKTCYTPDASSSIDSIRENDIIMAFEILPCVEGKASSETKTNSNSTVNSYAYSSYEYNKPKLPNDAGGNNLLQLRFCEATRDPYYHDVQIKLVGHPLVLSYPKNWTNKQLEEYIQEILRPLCLEGETDVFPSDTEVRVLGQNGEPLREQSTNWMGYNSQQAYVEFEGDDKSADNLFGLQVVYAEGTNPLDQNKIDQSSVHPSFPSSDGRAQKPKAALTLQSCLEASFKREKLGKQDTWYCPDCKNHVQAYKKMDIWSLGKIMVVQLKRFTQIMGLSILNARRGLCVYV